jgi:hypothetical protein
LAAGSSERAAKYFDALIRNCQSQKSPGILPGPLLV